MLSMYSKFKSYFANDIDEKGVTGASCIDKMDVSGKVSLPGILSSSVVSTAR